MGIPQKPPGEDCRRQANDGQAPERLDPAEHTPRLPPGRIDDDQGAPRTVAARPGPWPNGRGAGHGEENGVFHPGKLEGSGIEIPVFPSVLDDRDRREQPLENPARVALPVELEHVLDQHDMATVLEPGQR